MKLFDEDTFDDDLINSGAEEVKNEGGFFIDLESSISKGLISTLKALISNSGISDKIMNDISDNKKNSKTASTLKKKGIVGMALEMIGNFFKRNTKKKEKLKSPKKIDTLLNSQGTEISKLKKEDKSIETQLFKNSEKIEEVMDFIMNYMENNEMKTEKRNTEALNTSRKKEKNYRDM
ncbi:hypothetical protein EII29_04810 [Leptotrichia sp. OH3620_COT-345]|uniref:hypothetical protein n=1 Tax=Leptotrichia sp. OH3620_COT-345 TaxID=2491048 RepID=UPI000F6510CC|nr:hypothetical protein [Leptotrichia sp. OH3620_COT-345]RRD39846.1 hypothetical protein EII29_04810 [Leptotrichia sp. OH3620_COT-345]